MSINSIIRKYTKKSKFGLGKRKFNLGNKETLAYLAIGGIGAVMLYFILTKQQSGIGVFDQITGGIGSASRLEGKGAGVLPKLPGSMDEGAVKEAAFTDWYTTNESTDDRLIVA